MTDPTTDPTAESTFEPTETPDGFVSGVESLDDGVGVRLELV